MFTSRDLTGNCYGKLIALEPTEKRESRYVVWRCMCDCGKEFFASTKKLQRGTIADCGCVPKNNRKNGSILADLTGEVFGSLTALKRAANKGPRTAWLCRCECGNETVVSTHDLRNGHTKSCGCRPHNHPYFRDLSGQRFGYLEVLRKLEDRSYKGSVMWECKCDCGAITQYSEDALVHGNSVSCGCYRDREIRKKIYETLHRIDGTCIERLNIQKPRSDNRSGYVGVQKLRDGRYRASIGFKGKRYYLGTYETVEEAIAARRRGEQIHIDFLKKYYEAQKMYLND